MNKEEILKVLDKFICFVAKDGCERDLSALFAARNIVKEEYKLKFYASLIALIITFVIFSSLMLIAYFIYR